MNYKRLYGELISRAKVRGSITGYKERHHIIPRSMGGSDEKSNLVDLTAREHFIAHMCLALIYGGTQWAAVVIMKGNNQYNNSRLFEKARLEYSNSQIGKEITEKTRKKLSDAKIGRPPNSAGKPLTDTHKEKLRILYVGIPRSEADKKAISKGSIGKIMPPISDEHRAKLQEAKIGNKPNNFGKPWSESRRAKYEKSKFDRSCIKLNKLIDSIFTPIAA